MPHDEKLHRGGEDAVATDEYTLALGDGVGGWNNHGVNPGLFSRALVENVVEKNKLKPNLTIKTIAFQAC